MVRLISYFILVAVLWVYPACADANLLPGDIGARAVDSKNTRFTLITSDGYISFSVPDNWRMLSVEGQPPNAHMLFQVDNPADHSSPDSTNMVLQFFPKSAVGLKKRLELFGKNYGESEPRRADFEGWLTIEQEASQNATLYTVADAKREIADIIVVIRLGWPHLKNNPLNYDDAMRQTFRAIMHSFDGGLGEYSPHPDDRFQRKSSQ